MLGMRWGWKSGPPNEELITKGYQSIGGDNMQPVKEAAFTMDS